MAKTAAIAACLLLLALGTFAPSFDNGFRRDDFTCAAHAAAAVHHPAAIWSRWVDWPCNRPVWQLGFYLEYRAWGLHPGLYLVTNTVLHALNALLLFVLLAGPLSELVALGAALFFVVGVGFYGNAVMWAANLSELLSTCFVLATAIAAARAQRADGPARRMSWLAAMTAAYALGLGSKESAVVAIVAAAGALVLAGAGIRSMLRSIAPMLVVLAAYFVFQLATGTGIAGVSLDGRTLLGLPWRALQLAAFMILPGQPGSSLVAGHGNFLQEVVSVAITLRRLLAIALVPLTLLGLWRGPARLRWLLATFGAFLLPFGLVKLPSGWLDIRYAYLPAAMLCALVSYAAKWSWGKSGRVVRAGLVVAVLGIAISSAVLLRQLEQKYDAMARSPESRAQMIALQARVRGGN